MSSPPPLRLLGDVSAVTRTSGSAPLVHLEPQLAAYRGDVGRANDLLVAAHREATTRGQGLALSVIECSRVVLSNGMSRYEEAAAAAELGAAHERLDLRAQALVELVEAVALSGRRSVAVAALERLTERTGLSA